MCSPWWNWSRPCRTSSLHVLYILAHWTAIPRATRNSLYFAIVDRTSLYTFSDERKSEIFYFFSFSLFADFASFPIFLRRLLELLLPVVDATRWELKEMRSLSFRLMLRFISYFMYTHFIHYCHIFFRLAVISIFQKNVYFLIFKKLYRINFDTFVFNSHWFLLSFLSCQIESSM